MPFIPLASQGAFWPVSVKIERIRKPGFQQDPAALKNTDFKSI
jgi:hypothetical protein